MITLQKIKPEIETHYTCGWRRADWLLQKRLEAQIEPKDVILRKKYDPHIRQTVKPDTKKQRVRKTSRRGVQEESESVGGNQDNESVTSSSGKAKIKLP